MKKDSRWAAFVKSCEKDGNIEIWRDFEGDLIVFDCVAKIFYGTFECEDEAEKFANNLSQYKIDMKYYNKLYHV